MVLDFRVNGSLRGLVRALSRGPRKQKAAPPSWDERPVDALSGQPVRGVAQNAEPVARVPGDEPSDERLVCSTKEPVALVSGLRFMDTPSVPDSELA